MNESIDEIRRKCLESQIRSERRRLTPRQKDYGVPFVCLVIFLVTIFVLLTPR